MPPQNQSVRLTCSWKRYLKDRSSMNLSNCTQNFPTTIVQLSSLQRKSSYFWDSFKIISNFMPRLCANVPHYDFRLFFVHGKISQYSNSRVFKFHPFLDEEAGCCTLLYMRKMCFTKKHILIQFDPVHTGLNTVSKLYDSKIKDSNSLLDTYVLYYVLFSYFKKIIPFLTKKKLRKAPSYVKYLNF